MRNLILFVIVHLVYISYGQQDHKIDQRMLEYHGDDAINLFNNNREYYDFLVYELDHCFFILESSESASVILDKDETIEIDSVFNVKGEPFNISLLTDKEKFDFHTYNFVRAHEDRTYYDLGDGRVLVFYSLKEVKSNYLNK